MAQALHSAAAIFLAAVSHSSSVFAKQPGATYCFNKVCHRVMTAKEVEERLGRDEKVKSSFYDDCKIDPDNPCTKTSSGEQFRPDLADNAASPIYPNGTLVRVTNPSNGRSVTLRINNSGPYHKSRTLDVSRAAAELLGFIGAGVADLTVRPLTTFDAK